ncbi:MAG: hypothetical protein Q9188_000195 [Gyalolechia gomerana]
MAPFDHIPLEISGYRILPISLPPLPSYSASATHYLYLRPHGPKLPTQTAARSLFLVNVPIDSTETHIKSLFSIQLGLPQGRIEEVEFAGRKSKRGRKEDIAAKPSERRQGKKRKRGPEAEAIEDLEGAALPATWDQELRKDGLTAVVVFVDRPSMDAACKAVRRIHKTGEAPIWGEGLEGKILALGSEHKGQLLQSVNKYMTEFAAREAAQVQLQARQRRIPDEEGFITVTKGGRSGPARQDVAQEVALKQKEKRRGLEDFYRFQHREKKKAKAAELMRKFEEDKEKVKRMKERRGTFKGNTKGNHVLPIKPETPSEKGKEDSGHAASHPQDESQNSGSYGAQPGKQDEMGTSSAAGGSYPAGTAPANSYSLPNYGGSPMPPGSGGSPIPTDPPMYPYPNTTTCYASGCISTSSGYRGGSYGTGDTYPTTTTASGSGSGSGGSSYGGSDSSSLDSSTSDSNSADSSNLGPGAGSYGTGVSSNSSSGPGSSTEGSSSPGSSSGPDLGSSDSGAGSYGSGVSGNSSSGPGSSSSSGGSSFGGTGSDSGSGSEAGTYGTGNSSSSSSSGSGDSSLPGSGSGSGSGSGDSNFGATVSDSGSGSGSGAGPYGTGNSSSSSGSGSGDSSLGGSSSGSGSGSSSASGSEFGGSGSGAGPYGTGNSSLSSGSGDSSFGDSGPGPGPGSGSGSASGSASGSEFGGSGSGAGPYGTGNSSLSSGSGDSSLGDSSPGSGSGAGSGSASGSGSGSASGSEFGGSGSGGGPYGTGNSSLSSGSGSGDSSFGGTVSGSGSGFGGSGSGNNSSGLGSSFGGSGYGSGDSGAGASCPQQSSVTVTETVSVTVTVTASGGGSEETTGFPSYSTSNSYPPYGDDIGTTGTGTTGGLPYPTGGRYSNGTISTNGRGGSVGSGTPSLDALWGSGAGVAADY